MGIDKVGVGTGVGATIIFFFWACLAGLIGSDWFSVVGLVHTVSLFP